MSHVYKITLSEFFEIEAENEREAKIEALQRFAKKYNTGLNNDKKPEISVTANMEAFDLIK